MAAAMRARLGSIAVAVDGSLLLVAMTDPDIRRVAPDGTIDLFAGPSTGAPFVDLWVDGSGDVVVADNGSNRVWRLDPAGR